MRHNGLSASSWVLIAHLDPRVADAALDALRRAGVAAYTNPHPGIQRPYLDVLPNASPTDQLYVDSEARERAHEVLVGLQEGEPADANHTEIDAEFARIVAELEGSDTELTEAPPRSETPTPTATGWEIVGSARQDPPDAPVPALDDEHFIPPPPPPVPRGDAVGRFAWLGLLGAPLLSFVFLMLGWTLESWQALLLAGAFVGGFVTLVVRMGNDDVDDDPENGAVV